MFEIDPIARGHGQEIGGAPDHVVLELADLAVGVPQLPHHFDDAEPALLIHGAHEDAGKRIEIARLTLDQRRGGDQLIRRAGIKPKAACEEAVKFAFFDVGWFAVERDHVNQQRRCRQTISGIVKRPIVVRGGRNNFGNELAESVKHRSVYRSWVNSADRRIGGCDVGNIWAGNSNCAIRASSTPYYTSSISGNLINYDLVGDAA